MITYVVIVKKIDKFREINRKDFYKMTATGKTCSLFCTKFALRKYNLQIKLLHEKLRKLRLELNLER